MSWPYHLVDLTEQQKHERRILLDRYGVYAQLSALVPILVYQLYRLGVWVYSERQRSKIAYAAVPSSPRLKQSRHSTSGAVVRKWRSTAWWLEGEIAPGWGLREYWIAGGCWATWLLFLCIHKTGDDYLHITKRFGVVAASQFPVHYMLSMKSLYSPLAFAFNTSHEQLNPWHRLSGRIVYFFLLLHATWYMNYFVQAGVLYVRLTSLVPIIGVISFSLLTALVTTALESVRRWSYRVFFLFHLTIGVFLLPLLFFHAKPLRLYVVEALALFIFDIVCRKLDTVTGFATITSVPHTKLIKLKVPIPPSKIQRFRAAPGQHVYLSIPPESVPAAKSSPSIHEFLLNPFTVADVSTSDITLVLRALHGPTTKTLNTLSKLSKAKPPINIEGPLGSSRRFPSLAAKFDRILLVAGGVGGTFTLPIYHHLREQLDAEAKSPEKLTFTWSMRSASEAAWAIGSEEGRDLEGDEHVKIYLTGQSLHNNQYNEELLPVDGSVELDELQSNEEPVKASGGRDRPDLRKIVDETFKHGNEEQVAVLFCGPQNMARELRGHVGRWVEKGRHVFWHDESFGW